MAGHHWLLRSQLNPQHPLAQMAWSQVWRADQGQGCLVSPVRDKEGLMADPFTWATIGAGASLIGGGVSAYGSLQKGAADQAMYNYQAGVAQLNQKIALQNASYAVQSGESSAYQSGLKTGATVAQQKVDQSASGFDVAGGSAAGVRQSTTALGVYDQNLIRTNFAKKAYGFEVEAATKG